MSLRALGVSAVDCPVVVAVVVDVAVAVVGQTVLTDLLGQSTILALQIEVETKLLHGCTCPGWFETLIWLFPCQLDIDTACVSWTEIAEQEQSLLEVHLYQM